MQTEAHVLHCKTAMHGSRESQTGGKGCRGGGLAGNDGAMEAGVHARAHAEDGLAEDVRARQPGPRQSSDGVAQPCMTGQQLVCPTSLCTRYP